MSVWRLNTATGLLENVKYIPSPNFNERPPNMVIDLLVIHNISLPPGQFGGSFVEALFTNTLDSTLHPYFQEIAHLKVASHLFIRRTGEVIQFVPLTQRAWHAGISYFQDRDNCNDFSIGIELEGTDVDAYEQIQYQQLAKLTQLIRYAYPAITPDRIVGHSDIAPSRKTDPGVAFDWHYYRQLI